MEGKKRYAIASPTSMGVRITPENRQGVHTSSLYMLQATSAETNVLNIASSLGHECLALTKFVEGSPVAQFIQSALRARNIRCEGKSVPQGGPWGYRHQFNIADSGFGLRGPRVWNDRAGEVGRTLSIGEFDIPRIFGEEGVSILHISGLIAALSPETGEFCAALAGAAREYGTVVSFDLNYRASFWKGREAELRRIFDGIASLADVLVGNEEDFQLALDLSGPEAGGEGLGAKIEGFKGMIAEAKKQYPNAKYFATTLREVKSANEHLWGALLHADGRWFVEDAREIPVLDRIGGGDGFTGGLLYGVYRGWEPEKCLQFGWACGALAVTELADYATPADEEQVWSIHKGNARVKR
ncbi:MAG: 2-dehydro-3-deoxygluconokinase [Firmicutes bacterium ADurb.Bin248]|nr:MAG: 2-dehydro-3-deoxygluconokinase [Firmicutes bacterium ADurb.Bin248]HOG00417.1 PfkB family carbohydrate kinase [Clostridia bacterium]HPK15153.1 PfkB family carbohydrate kinase [Clostridia bacterium]